MGNGGNPSESQLCGNSLRTDYVNGREDVEVLEGTEAVVDLDKNANNQGGEIVLNTASGYLRGWMGVDDAENGFVQIDRSGGNTSAALEVTSSSDGYLTLYDEGGDQRVVAGESTQGNGCLWLYDSSNNNGATFCGNGSKNFVAEHPLEAESAIVYASLEGPEAAMYHRGTARLSGGYARIEFPEHFALLAAEEGMTATLTPRSSETYGLAHVELTPDHMVVEELAQGTGNFEFDYVVHAVRKRHEDYRVVRPWTEVLPQERVRAREHQERPVSY